MSADDFFVSYLMDIDVLDSEHATFRHTNPMNGESAGSLTITRSEWEQSRRPGHIEVTVTERQRDDR